MCNTLKADGCDVAVIRVAIKDEKGRVVPTANNLVKFTIEGPGKIIGTGNGNPTSYEPDKASQRMAFNGYCLVLVQSEKKAGEIRLKAESENLKGAVELIKAEKNLNDSESNNIYMLNRFREFDNMITMQNSIKAIQFRSFVISAAVIGHIFYWDISLCRIIR